MKREIIALLLLSLLLLPMFAGVRRLKSLPKQRDDRGGNASPLSTGTDESDVEEERR